MPNVEGRTRRATSADVARLAGVSRATVSYVLNDVPHQTIPQATRQRVTDAAAQLHYRPSPAARALRTGRSDVVLGLIPHVRYSHVYAQFFDEMSAALGEVGMTLVVHPYTPSVLRLDDVWKTITPDAVVAFGTLDDHDVAAMRAAGIEVAVALSGQRPQHPWEVSFGDQSVGHLQAEHLLERGHRHVGVALPEDRRVTGVAVGRVDGITSRVAAAGGSVVVRSLDLDDPDEQLLAWVREEPAMTAIAAWNDEVAFALVAAAARHGIDVPGRLAVLGAYDHAIGTIARPTLSTVRVDVRARVRAISASLVAAVRGGELTLGVTDTSTLELVARDST